MSDPRVFEFLSLLTELGNEYPELTQDVRVRIAIFVLARFLRRHDAQGAGPGAAREREVRYLIGPKLIAEVLSYGLGDPKTPVAKSLPADLEQIRRTVDRLSRLIGGAAESIGSELKAIEQAANDLHQAARES